MTGSDNAASRTLTHTRTMGSRIVVGHAQGCTAILLGTCHKVKQSKQPRLPAGSSVQQPYKPNQQDPVCMCPGLMGELQETTEPEGRSAVQCSRVSSEQHCAAAAVAVAARHSSHACCICQATSHADTGSLAACLITMCVTRFARCPQTLPTANSAKHQSGKAPALDKKELCCAAVPLSSDRHLGANNVRLYGNAAGNPSPARAAATGPKWD